MWLIAGLEGPGLGPLAGVMYCTPGAYAEASSTRLCAATKKCPTAAELPKALQSAYVATPAKEVGGLSLIGTPKASLDVQGLGNLANVTVNNLKACCTGVALHPFPFPVSTRGSGMFSVAILASCALRTLPIPCLEAV